MTPTFSLLHSTYGRPQKAAEAMRMWFERAAQPNSVEYILAVNEYDESALGILARVPIVWRAQVQTVKGFFPGSAPAWDAAAKVSTGSILVQAQDDVEPPSAWDTLLLMRLERARCLVLVDVKPLVIHVSDGFRKDGLMTTAIMNRARYEQQGEFLHAGYSSVFSDDEHTVRALADNEAGKCTLIDARDLVFRHAHHYHLPNEVPWDATYSRQNVPEKYEAGRRLFMERNSALLKWRTWA